jgi:hypothetical protein
MNIKIEIECKTINDFHSQLTVLANQVKKSAKKQKLNVLKDEFEREDSDSLCDDNSYGTCDVIINSLEYSKSKIKAVTVKNKSNKSLSKKPHEKQNK